MLPPVNKLSKIFFLIMYVLYMIFWYMRILCNRYSTFITLCDFWPIVLYVYVLVHMYSDEYFDTAVVRIQGVLHVLYFVCCITNALISVFVL